MVDKIGDLKNALEDENYGLSYQLIEKDGALLFRAHSYHLEFFKHLQQFQEAEKFCDVILKAGSGNSFNSVKAHKLILSSASSYFRAMFTGGFKENDICQEIVLDHVNYLTLSTIVKFIYSGEIIVKDTNVQMLLPVAKMLQIEEIVNACCIFLYKNMDASNCIGIEEFAKSYGCVHLARQAQQYMHDHFVEIITSEEFLNLDQHQLCKLLRRDELKVRCESIVFKAVVDWVKFKPEERRCHLDHLFQCVRFYTLPPKFLKDQICNNDLFRCKDADKSRQLMQQVCDELISHKPCPIAPRRPNLSFALFVIGGYQKQSISLVESLKPTTGTWDKVAEMRVPRSGVSCISMALYIFAIGGRNNNGGIHGNVDCADVECYDPFTNQWRSCAPMNAPRSRSGVGVIDGLIYAVGGAHGAKFHSSVERYSLQEDRWEFVSPMLMPRIGLGSAVVNRLLYAIGGFDGTNRLRDVEVYNPDQNAWYLVASMNTPRSGAGVAHLGNHIYVIGGYTTNLQLNSVERYDTQTNQWSFVAPMSVPRSALASVTWNEKIYAIGGYTGTEFLATIEVYDPNENKWTESTSMTSERSGHGAVVTVEACQGGGAH